MFQSKDRQFNCVKDFHALMDGETQETPVAYDQVSACHRVGFKVEELVEFLRATVADETEFDHSVRQLHEAVDQAVSKVREKSLPQLSLVGQVDALMDLLYFTYGSVVLMGVDPEPIFDIVHRSNMGKVFPDGKAHFDPVTHKILKPDDWEERYAPEPAIAANLDQQLESRI